MFELGKKARDKITGFEGTLTGRAEYLTGCTQYAFAPRVGADGKIPDTQWFDEGRVEIIGDGVTAGEVAGNANGGPQRDAPRM